MLEPFSGSGPRDYTCECGKRYEVTRHKLITRDRDEIDCSCGRRIIEWNQAASYVAREMKPDGSA